MTSGPQDDPTKALNVGVAAHITSAASGGPRYNPSLSSEQRRHPDNGIWLCQTHAKLVDNDISQFPTDVLRAWKTIAEHKAKNSIGKKVPTVPESDAQRKCREILAWKSKYITLTRMNTGKARMLGAEGGSSQVKVLDCSEFCVTVRGDDWDRARSISLTNVEITFDDREKRLKLQECYT